MKPYGKCISESQIEVLIMPIKAGNQHIFTNDDKMIKFHGYKPIIYSNPEPKIDYKPTGFKWIEVNIDGEDVIAQEWQYENIIL